VDQTRAFLKGRTKVGKPRTRGLQGCRELFATAEGEQQEAKREGCKDVENYLQQLKVNSRRQRSNNREEGQLS
jgi:hypothetical protein